jgi:hypothetical protein
LCAGAFLNNVIFLPEYAMAGDDSSTTTGTAFARNFSKGALTDAYFSIRAELFESIETAWANGCYDIRSFVDVEVRNVGTETIFDLEN